MSDLRRFSVGHVMSGRDPLHDGAVKDGGRRIYVWTDDIDSGHRITVAHSFEHRAQAGLDGERIVVEGTVSVGRLSADQAEALIGELQLAVRASRLRDGEPWAGREIAPGIVRAPETSVA